MATSTTVRVEGLRELDAALGQLPPSVGKAVLRRVLKQAAVPIYEYAHERAPMRPAGAPKVTYMKGGQERIRRPGTLKVLVQSGTRLTRRQAAMVRKEGKWDAEHYVGTRDPIGRLIEFGTAHSPAEPFMRPAWDYGAPIALKLIGDKLGEGIDKAAKRVARKAAKG